MLTNRVLLAHHDTAVQELALRALTRIGVAVDVVPDPADAVLRLAGERYSVIAAEREDALLAAIAETYAEKRPVVIITAPTADRSDLDANLVSMLVPEPYDPQTLVGVILACVTPVVPPGVMSLPAETGRDLE